MPPGNSHFPAGYFLIFGAVACANARNPNAEICFFVVDGCKNLRIVNLRGFLELNYLPDEPFPFLFGNVSRGVPQEGFFRLFGLVAFALSSGCGVVVAQGPAGEGRAWEPGPWPTVRLVPRTFFT